jgi:hypothetical protein
MDKTFKAVVIEEVDGKWKACFKTLGLSDLPLHDVLVEVEFSSLKLQGRSCSFRPAENCAEAAADRRRRSRRNRHRERLTRVAGRRPRRREWLGPVGNTGRTAVDT